MVLETIAITAITEWLRSKIPKRKVKNNKYAIDIIEREMPTFETVGELRELLKNFADDVPTRGGFNYPMLQVRVLSGQGRISFGSSSHVTKCSLLNGKFSLITQQKLP